MQIKIQNNDLCNTEENFNTFSESGDEPGLFIEIVCFRIFLKTEPGLLVHF